MEPLPYESTWPAEWSGQQRSRRLLATTIFLALFPLGFAAAVVAALIEHDPVSAVSSLAVAIYFGHLTAMGLHTYRGGRHRNDTTGVRTEPEGLVFRYGALPTYLVSAFLGMTTVVLAGMSILAGNAGTTTGYLNAATLGTMGVVMAVFLAVFLRLAPGRVVIAPDGIHHRGLTFTHFVPWLAVTDVAALWNDAPEILIHTIGSPATVTRNYLGRATSGPQFDTVSGRWLAADPALLLQALAHYITHPADRPELSDGRALHRIARH